MTEKPNINKSLFQKMISFSKAMMFGTTDISPERLAKRLEICSECPLVIHKGGTNFECGVCGCQLSADKRLRNLARFEETKDYGCYRYYDDNPELPERSAWKRGGV